MEEKMRKKTGWVMGRWNRSADVRLRTEGVLQSFGKALHCDLQSFTRRPARLAERCHQIVGHVVLLLPRRLVEGEASLHFTQYSFDPF